MVPQKLTLFVKQGKSASLLSTQEEFNTLITYF